MLLTGMIAEDSALVGTVSHAWVVIISSVDFMFAGFLEPCSTPMVSLPLSHPYPCICYTRLTPLVLIAYVSHITSVTTDLPFPTAKSRSRLILTIISC